MFWIYLIVCLVLTVIAKRLTRKNYNEIEETKKYLDNCEKVSIKVEQIEKRNIRAIHKLWIMNQKNKLTECRRK